MKILASTFTEGDDEKVILAMRSLPYDRIILMGGGDARGSSLARIRRLEQLSGHDVAFHEIDESGLMQMVDSISEILAGPALDGSRGERDEFILNISGGSKLMGDAALLAAFRLGIEAFLCDKVVVKLPILKGATAKDRFTEHQARLMDILANRELTLAKLIKAMQPNSKASAERTIRELKRQGLIKVRTEGGTVLLGLSPEGAEVARVTRFAQGR